MRGRMHAHFGDGVVRPAREIFRKKPEGQPQQPHEPARLPMRMMLDLHAHEEGVVGIVEDFFREIDDALGAK